MEFMDNRNGFAISEGNIIIATNQRQYKAEIEDIKGFGFLQLHDVATVNFVKARDRYEYGVDIEIRGQSNITIKNHEGIPLSGTILGGIAGLGYFHNKTKRSSQEDFFSALTSALMQYCSEQILIQILNDILNNKKWECDAFSIDNMVPYITVEKKIGMFKKTTEKVKLSRGETATVFNGYVVIQDYNIAYLYSINAWIIPTILELYSKFAF